MLRKLMVGGLAAAALTLSTSAFAQGTAAEAKAMLEKAVAAVKADKAKAIEMFNKGEGGFKDRDLTACRVLHRRRGSQSFKHFRTDELCHITAP